MKKTLFVFLAMAGMALAQDPAPSPTATPTRLQKSLWKAVLPGGEYWVRFATINSISLHEYVVDNAARVAEVNLGTSSNETVRFYCIEPNVPKAPGGVGQSVLDKAEEKASELLNRTRMDETWQKVMKNYPTTTHAHTIEYRLPDRATLNNLFESLKESFENQRAGVFKP